MPSPDPRHGATRFSHHHLVQAGAEDGRLVFANRCSMDASFYAIVWQRNPNPFPAAALSMGHPPSDSCPSDHGFPGKPVRSRAWSHHAHHAGLTPGRHHGPFFSQLPSTTASFHHGPLGIPRRRHTWATAADPGLTDTRLENEFGYVPASYHDMLRPFPRSPTTPTPSRGPFLSCAHALGSAITQPRPHV